MPTTEEETGNKLIPWAFCILLFILLILSFINYNMGIQQTKNDYSIESKLLINQYNEQNEYLENHNISMEEWIEIRNHHLEKQYNIMLEYRDEYLEGKIRNQEKCLEELKTFKQIDDANAFNKTSKKCNKIGENIRIRHLAILKKKVGDNQ